MRIDDQRRHAVPWLVAAAVSALAFGSIGGSLQLSRLLCAVLIPVVLLRILDAPGRTRFQSEIRVFCVVLMFVSVASLAWSIDRTTTVQYLVVLAVNISPLLVTGLLRPEELAFLQKLLPRAWLLAGTIMLPLALFELTTGIHIVQGFDERGGGDLAGLLPFASGLHGNFNDFSLFLVLCILGVCFEANDAATGRWMKIWKTSALALMTMVVLVNSSRGAIIGLVPVLAVRFLLMFPKRYLILPLLVLVFVVIASGVTDDESLLLTYLMLKFSDFSTDLESGGGRLGIFIAGVQGFFSSYGLGVGAGASSSYLATDPSVFIPNPHNLFLEWGLNFGFVGLCVFIWFILRLWATAMHGAQRKMISVAVFILPVLGVIQSHLTGYTYFWLMLATLAVFALEPRSKAKE